MPTLAASLQLKFSLILAIRLPRPLVPTSTVRVGRGLGNSDVLHKVLPIRGTTEAGPAITRLKSRARLDWSEAQSGVGSGGHQVVATSTRRYMTGGALVLRERDSKISRITAAQTRLTTLL
jgi:hypothetical protein